MKIKTINKICNLEKKIELLKKKILEVQIKKIGELTYSNLEKINFIDIDFSDNEEEKKSIRRKKQNLMELLKMKEYDYNKQLKMNNDNDYVNNQKKEENNMKEKKKKIKKDFSEKLIKMNNSFTTEKKKLDEELIKLKQKRKYNLNLKRFNDDKIIFLLDKITHFREHNNSLKKSIKEVKKEIKDYEYYCEYKVEEYQNEHKKTYDSICGGSNSNNNNKIETCKNKMEKWNMKKLNCKLLFMEKYNIYLGEFYEICNKYGEKENGIIKDCIIFTREQVEDKINELEVGVKNLENKYYEVNDEDIIKKDYENEIIKLEENYKLKIENRKKEIEKILNSVKNIIEQYKKQKKLKSREEIMEYIDDLKKQKEELEYINEDLEEKYKNLIEIKLNIEPNCLEKLNIMKADSLKEIYLKKKECVEK
tara:strand:+ start:253 stop:1515 length:1263 start_codon:yes stop_codon:yes gene_type:complete